MADGDMGVGAFLPGEDPEFELELALLPRNDFGSGQRLVKREGRDLLALPGKDAKSTTWLLWSGRKWQIDTGGDLVHRTAHMVVQAMRREAAALEREATTAGSQLATQKMADAHWKFAAASGNSGKVRAMLSEAVPYLAVAREDLDASPWLLTLANGTLDLGKAYLPGTGPDAGPGGAPPPSDGPTEDDYAAVRHRLLRGHDRGDRITMMAGTDRGLLPDGLAYDPDAGCPRFLAFLERVQPDPGQRRYLQDWAGLCLTGHTAPTVALFHGAGANGKSTFLNILRGVMGDYACTLPFSSLTDESRRGGGDATPDLTRLPGKRLVMASEPRVGVKLDEGILKAQTGGEPIMVRPLYGDAFEFRPTHKLVLGFNNVPRIPAQDYGTWRRLVLVPWPARIPDREADPDLAARIVRTEAAGVLNWMIDGLMRWRAQGLVPPDSIRGATAQLKAEQDPLSAWLEACVVLVEPDGAKPKGTIRASELYEIYKLWAGRNGVEPISQTRFGRGMMNDHQVERTKAGLMFYTGLDLTDHGRELRAINDNKSRGNWAGQED